MPTTPGNFSQRQHERLGRLVSPGLHAPQRRVRAATSSAVDRHWIIRFESVNYRATVWLNGRKIGSHKGAYLPFEFDLTGLRRGRQPADRAGRPPPLVRQTCPPGPGGGWWNYGGIMREVYLRAVQRVDISQVQVRPILTCPTCAATIEDQAADPQPHLGKRQTVQLRGTYGGAKLDFGSATIGPHSDLDREGDPRRSSIRGCGRSIIGVLYRATLTLADHKGRRLGGYVELERHPQHHGRQRPPRAQRPPAEPSRRQHPRAGPHARLGAGPGGDLRAARRLGQGDRRAR